MEIQIYTSPTCGNCVHMRTLLSRANLTWKEYVIGDTITIDEFRSKYPNIDKTPFTVVNDGELTMNFPTIVEVAKFLLKKGLVSPPEQKQEE